VTALLLLLTCLVLGAIFGRCGPPPGLAHSLNWWVINIAVPALVLRMIPTVQFSTRLWFLPAALWFELAFAWLLFEWLGRRLGWSRTRIGALILCAGFSNSGFMGYPMIEALRGREALGLAVIADQIGCFLALATVGTAITAMYAGRQVPLPQIVRRIVLFPSFVALVVAVAASLAGGFPDAVVQVLQRLGDTMSPLALFSVGLQFRLRLDRSQVLAAGSALAFKMLLAPLLVYAGGVACGVTGEVLAVGVLQTAMAPMISAAILAAQYELEPRLANSVLGIGILLSLATVPLANAML
jgi:predicted permease